MAHVESRSVEHDGLYYLYTKEGHLLAGPFPNQAMADDASIYASKKLQGAPLEAYREELRQKSRYESAPYQSSLQNPPTDNVNRERNAARGWTRGALTNLGFSKYAARDIAKKIFGDPADADASFSESLALVDFIPGVNLAFFGPESYRQFKQGKIVEPSLNLAGSIIEGGVLLKFLGSLGKKASPVVKGDPTIAGYLRQFNPE